MTGKSDTYVMYPLAAAGFDDGPPSTSELLMTRECGIEKRPLWGWSVIDYHPAARLGILCSKRGYENQIFII